MQLKHTCAFAIAIVLSGLAAACEGPFPLIGVQYRVSEQSPDRVEALVTNPLERLLMGTPRLANVASTTSHGTVDIELRFDGGATGIDLAQVKQRIGEMRFAEGVEVKSTNVFFASTCWQRWPLGPFNQHGKSPQHGDLPSR
ncbi:efflux RND transporter permease subunit [Massilia aurea]|uniref:efflux RND transporter permease subunit n=1 Tax=Massilia aurea TaxID=373040 RepID=UPI00346283F0